MYLVALGDGEPSLNNLTVEKVLSCDLDNANRLCVGVILVPHIKHQTIRFMAYMDLVKLIK